MAALRDNLLAFMRLRGWEEPAGGGPTGALWSRPDTPWRVPVPWELDEQTADWTSIIDRLSKTEDLDPREVERRIRLAAVDVLNLRVVAFGETTESIPYKAGVSLAQSGWSMLRACATTAMGTKANIKGNYRRAGDEIVNLARMAHTRQGSYVIPIYVPLTEPAVLPGADALPGFESVVPDPPERRVTRTFAAALEAVERVVITPEKAPTKEGLIQLVSAGVSREFTSSLNNILEAGGLRAFSTEFDWAASTAGAEARLDRRVEIPADAAKLVEEVATRLRRFDETQEPETLTGTVVGVYRDNDGSGRVTISTARGGRPCNVHVNVSSAVLTMSLDWMKRREDVVAQGTVRRVGDGLQVDGLDHIRMLRETSRLL